MGEARLTGYTVCYTWEEESVIKKIFFLLIVGLIAYSLFLIAVPHFNYFAFKSDLNELMRVSISRPDLITEEIMTLAEKYDIPITEEDIKLRRDEFYSVSVSWEETIDFLTLYQKTFKFHIDTSK